MQAFWTKRTIVITTLTVVTALALFAAFAQLRSSSTERAALLMAIPDEVPSIPSLDRLAMSSGRSSFFRYCAPCHGAHGEPDARRGVPDLRDSDWLYGSGRVSEIERVVLYGIRSGDSKGWDLASMPAFATPNPYERYKMLPLGPQEIHDVTEYVYSLQHASADPDAAARGKQLFYNQSRGLCWDCHGDRAQGDPGIGAPNLRDPIWLYGDGSRESIYASIAYGRAGSCPAWLGKLSPATIVSLAVYTHSLSARTTTAPSSNE
jgi:cytochrome c oxidase cbb3-type subunit 3